MIGFILGIIVIKVIDAKYATNFIYRDGDLYFQYKINGVIKEKIIFK